jgi:hypothetical protein
MEKPRQSIWRRAFRVWFFLMACGVTAMALFYAEEDWRGKHAWENFKRETEAKGGSLDWQSYIPRPVPNDENFAMTPLLVPLFEYDYSSNGRAIWRDTNGYNRAEDLTRWGKSAEPGHGDWSRGRRVDLKAWQTHFRTTVIENAEGKNVRWPSPPSPGDPASDVILALGKFAPELDELRAASARPYSQFPVHYEEMAVSLLAHLAVLKRSARMVQLRAIAELNLSEPDKAADDVLLSLALADALRSEQFMISRLVRLETISESLQPIWEGLVDHRWTVTDLERIEKSLSKNDLLAEYQVATKAETAFLCAWIAEVPSHPDTLSLDGSTVPGMLEPLLPLVPRGWFYQNEISAARFFEEIALTDVSAAAGRVYPELSRTNQMMFDSLATNSHTVIFKQLGRYCSPQIFAFTQTALNLARVACAIERHRLKQGRLLESLDALVPDYLGHVPDDLVTGKPLIYKPNDGGGFVLYSVGWNQTDDNGAYPGKEDYWINRYWVQFSYHPQSGDWVWRCPGKK